MKLKRLLSLALALAMVLSLLPAAFAATENEEIVADSIVETANYEYVFNAQSHSLSGSPSVSTTTHRIDNTDTSVSSGRWGFVAMRTGTNYSTYGNGTDYLKWSFDLGGRVPSPWNDGASAMMAFEIEVKKAGTYKPSVAFFDNTASPKFELFLIEKPADGDTYYDDAVKVFTLAMQNPNSRIAHLDMYGTETGEVVRELDAVSLRATTYFFIIIPNGADERWTPVLKGDVPTYGIMDFNKFYLNEVAENTREYNYNLTFDAFRTDKMWWAANGSTSFEGIRQSGKGILMNQSFMSWKASTTYTTGGATTEEYDVMRLSGDNATAAWEFVKENNTAGGGLRVMGDGYTYYNVRAGIIFNADESKRTDTDDYWRYLGDVAASYVLYKVVVPAPGTYTLSVGVAKPSAGGLVPMTYFVKASESDDLSTTSKVNTLLDSSANNKVGYVNFSTKENVEGCNSVVGGYAVAGEVYVPQAGEYYIALAPDSTCKEKNYDRVLSSTTYYQDACLSGFKLTPVIDEEAAEKEAVKNEIINEDGGNTEAIGSVSTAATVNAFAAYIGGESVSGDVITSTTAEIGKDCTVTAKPIDGYKFLYWAKAFDKSRKILSDSAEYTFRPTTGATSIMAVYISDSAAPRKKAEFYNGNRQLLESFSGEFIVPELPTMAGHKKALHWVLVGSDKTYTGGEKLVADSEMLFVAEYNDPADVIITVENGSGSGTYAYGEEVTATATLREGGNAYNVFNYWEKDGVIVGFGTTYKFNAWENCTVKAVYKEYQPIAKMLTKIILKNAENNNVMAEFIGLDAAVEKGIIFGGKTLGSETYRTAMTGRGNQFAVENDESLSATGYAILKDGSVVYSK